jgi:AcrR family transcriptional regulator
MPRVTVPGVTGEAISTRRPDGRPDGRVERGNRTRQSVLERTVAIASVEGLEALSVGRLATELGLSKSGVFALFGSKEELQLATVREAGRIFAERVIRPVEEEPAGVRRVWRLCEAWLEYSRGRVACRDPRPRPAVSRLLAVQDGDPVGRLHQRDEFEGELGYVEVGVQLARVTRLGDGALHVGRPVPLGLDDRVVHRPRSGVELGDDLVEEAAARKDPGVTVDEERWIWRRATTGSGTLRVRGGRCAGSWRT